MFVYISFLRPPPVHAAVPEIVSVTPQISNDLRTEPFHGSQDLFYSWAQVQNPHQDNIFAKPKKLTTWRQSNAYKEIQVPLPSGLRSGQSWRLILSAKPHIEGLGTSHFSTIDLYDQALGTVPFPVISMPITFGGVKSAKRDGKQEKIERIYRLQVDEASPLLRIIEQTSFDLDKVCKYISNPFFWVPVV
jgi:protein N-lysine methyltransferase METTL21D